MPNTNSTISASEETALVLLRRVFRILRGCGLKTSKLSEICNEAMLQDESVPEPISSSATARQSLRCSDVVLRWRRDYHFVTEAGLPRPLSLASDSPTFAELVRVAAPGQDPAHLLRTMKELGVVKLIGRNRVKLISDSVVACSGRDASPVACEFSLEHVCGFLGSVEYNVFEKPSRGKGRFERACYASVPKNLVPVLERLVQQRGQDFVDVIDEWLSRRAGRRVKGESTALVGAGAYVFIRDREI